MNVSTDAVCIPARCGKTGKDFYMMYYKAFDDKWVLTYGKNELPYQTNSGRSNSIAVNLTPMRTGPQYKCPYCGEKYTFTCWNCGKRTCYDGDDHDGREVICAHCGKSGVFRSNSGDSSGSSGRNTKEIMGFGVNGQG